MSLTPAEKLAGRAFRDELVAWLEALNQSEPTVMQPPSVTRHVRHDCPARSGLSTSFEMKEIYVTSPVYNVCSCGAMIAGDEAGWHHPVSGCERFVVPAGRFALIYTEGKCACGMTGRSPEGRLVDAWERPPMGRTQRQWRTTGTAEKSPASGRTSSP